MAAVNLLRTNLGRRVPSLEGRSWWATRPGRRVHVGLLRLGLSAPAQWVGDWGTVSWRRALAAEFGSQQRWPSLCHLFGLGWCLLAGIPGTSSSEWGIVSLPRHSSEIHLLWGPLKKSSHSNEGPLFENLCWGVVRPSPPRPYPHSQMTLLGGLKAGGGPNLFGGGNRNDK